MINTTPAVQKTQPATTTEEPEVGFISRWFVQALFPYRKTKEQARTIQNGPERLTVFGELGLPYGRYPRLIMAYIITEAYHRSRQEKQGLLTPQEARRIPLGQSFSEFFKAVGITSTPTGGKRGSLTLVREQMERLAACQIKVSRLSQRLSGSDREAQPTIDVSNRHSLWTSPKPGSNQTTASYIELSEKFFNHITEKPIPIDLRILSQLKSPRAQDLYTWITLKKHWLSRRSDKEFTFNWTSIALHFSPKEITTSAQMRDFRRELRSAINELSQYWPEHGANITPEGLVIRQGPPSIPWKARQGEITR